MFGLRCIHLNIRSVLFILFSCTINGIRFSQTALNEMDAPAKADTASKVGPNLTKAALNEVCPMDWECSKLPYPCINCEFNNSCVYGKPVNVTCSALENVQCKDNRQFVRETICRYCYQTDVWDYDCVQRGFCNSMDGMYRTNCTVHGDVLCMGRRVFLKNVKCNWTKGYKYSSALILSITLGGFGVDRFYLGHWQEGIGKLFSFGGLGIWTLIDVILISLHYLGPADGSLYI